MTWPKTCSVAPLSMQLPLRDMLWTKPFSGERADVGRVLVLPAHVRVQDRPRPLGAWPSMSMCEHLLLLGQVGAHARWSGRRSPCWRSRRPARGRPCRRSSLNSVTSVPIFCHGPVSFEVAADDVLEGLVRPRPCTSCTCGTSVLAADAAAQPHLAHHLQAPSCRLCARLPRRAGTWRPACGRTRWGCAKRSRATSGRSSGPGRAPWGAPARSSTLDLARPAALEEIAQPRGPRPESSATARALSRFGSASAPSGQSIFLGTPPAPQACARARRAPPHASSVAPPSHPTPSACP